MKTSNDAIKMIIGFEGFSATPYKPVATEKYYTIGYGHYGADVKKDSRVTHAQAEALLISDLYSCEKRVLFYHSTYNWNQNEFDALVSFAYNLGVGNLDKLLAKGTRTRTQIANAWCKYVNAGGKVLTGLVRRRETELKLFMKPIVNHFPKCPCNLTSYVDGLKSVNADSTYAYRKKIGIANGIENYQGSREQNIYLLSLLKRGELIKP